jgi:hypothetical protein
MATAPRKRRRRKRKCIHCNEQYIPDPRRRRHQKHCSKPACRKASKRTAQQRWLLSKKGKGYFKGKANVRHVQAWRIAHPEYWKRSKKLTQNALQDISSLEPIVTQGDPPDLNAVALQDITTSQPALIVGLISNIVGSTLQDVIMETSRRLIISGRDILGIDPECKPTQGGR